MEKTKKDKRCLKCGVKKLIQHFGQDKNSHDGYKALCKRCIQEIEAKDKSGIELLEKCFKCKYAEISREFEDGSKSIRCDKYGNFVGFTKHNIYNNITLKCLKEELKSESKGISSSKRRGVLHNNKRGSKTKLK